MPLPPEAEQVAEDGWTVVEPEVPDPADDGRRELGFSGFFVVQPPPELGALFPVGTLMVSPGASVVLGSGAGFDGAAVREVLARLVTGDWGEVDPERRAANNSHLAGNDGEIRGFYRLADGRGFWAISSWDRLSTTLAGSEVPGGFTAEPNMSVDMTQTI